MSGDHHGRAADLTGELALDRRRAISRVARRVAGESRRVLLERRPAHQHRRGADQLGGQPLQSRRHSWPASAGLHQHDADHGLSRRRPSQRRLSVGAAGRRGRAATGIDSVKLRRRNVLRKDAFPLQDADRLVLRQRRSGAAARHRVAGGGLGRLRKRAARPRKTQRQAARHRACAVSRAVRRHGQGAGRDPRRAPTAGWRCTRNAGPSGQGHETVFPALVADVLGYPGGSDRTALQRRRGAEACRHRHVRLALADQSRRRAAAPRPRRSSRRGSKLAADEFEVEAARRRLRQRANTASPAPTSRSA